MLNTKQLDLLKHLAQYGVADYDACLRVLDTNRTGDRVKLSYVLRPLVRLGYISKRKDGLYGLLQKGRSIVSKVKPLVTVGGDESSRKRAATISGVAALLHQHGIPSAATYKGDTAVFIPAPCWRKIRPGLLSTVRFSGMLLMDNHRLAVYDIGDGEMDWQLYAERSLLFFRHGDDSTRANGMLYICTDGKRLEVAERIIRRTMWERKRLIEKASSFESNKRRRISHSPIRLHKKYERVFLADPSTLAKCLYGIINEAGIRQWLVEHKNGTDISWTIWDGDIETTKTRYYLLHHTDLLKFVKFFSFQKTWSEMEHFHDGGLTARLLIADIDESLMGLYSFMEGVGYDVFDTSRWNYPCS